MSDSGVDSGAESDTSQMSVGSGGGGGGGGPDAGPAPRVHNLVHDDDDVLQMDPMNEPLENPVSIKHNEVLHNPAPQEDDHHMNGHLEEDDHHHIESKEHIPLRDADDPKPSTSTSSTNESINKSKLALEAFLANRLAFNPPDLFLSLPSSSISPPVPPPSPNNSPSSPSSDDAPDETPFDPEVDVAGSSSPVGEGSSHNTTSNAFSFTPPSFLINNIHSMGHINYPPPQGPNHQSHQHEFRPKLKSFSRVKHVRDAGSYLSDGLNKRLRFAASNGDYEGVRRALDDGADSTSFDQRMRTPLHFAACRGHVQMGQLLLERGADPNHQDIVGNTPLHLAACTNHMEMITLLLKNGTDVSVLDKSGRSPLHLAESKLKILQSTDPDKLLSCPDLKIQVMHVIEMMQVYLKRSGKLAALDILSSFTNRLHLHQTKEEVDHDVHDLLASLNHLSLRPS